MDKLILAPDYRKIFDNKLVVITGLSRSGTSILGKIVGSLETVSYLHEPAIMRLISSLAKNKFMDFKVVSQLLMGILFEDYYLQLLHGRNLNYKESDNSYFGNYQSLETVKNRWLKYERRGDVLEDLSKGKYLFLLKITEIHPLLPVLEKIFKGLRVIHLIRDGNAVIASSTKRGWYTDKFLNSDMIQWMKRGKVNIPWLIPAEDVEKFSRWNSETRIAYIWRTLTEEAKNYGKGKGNYLELRYEDLVKNPEGIMNICEKFLNLRKTEVTLKNIEAVKKHVLTEHSDQTDDIAIEERPLFRKFMKELNYL